LEEDTNYIEHHFRVIDGKINSGNINNKKRGRRKGYKHTDETKDKIADKMKDRTKTDEEKQKISDKLKGRKKSLVTIKKISIKKRKTWPADDLLKDYMNPSRKEDREWLNNNSNDEERQELLDWIIENHDQFNEIAEDVKTYKDLKSDSMREQVELVEQYNDVRQKS